MTLDVSPDGFCMITGRPIAPGEQIYARLMLSDDDPGCIECHMATVMWSRDGRVGLKISLIEECERQRFVLLLHQLATVAGTRFIDPVNSNLLTCDVVGRPMPASGGTTHG